MHRAARQVAAYEHKTLSASTGLCWGHVFVSGCNQTIESLLKTAVLVKFTLLPCLDFFSFLEVNSMDDRCALVTKLHALRILFFTAPLGVKPPGESTILRQ